MIPKDEHERMLSNVRREMESVLAREVAKIRSSLAHEKADAVKRTVDAAEVEKTALKQKIDILIAQLQEVEATVADAQEQQEQKQTGHSTLNSE
jgi:hypothetical protein